MYLADKWGNPTGEVLQPTLKSQVRLYPFGIVDSGEWRHNRIDKERADALANTEVRSQRASKAAGKRRQRNPAGAPETDASSNAPSNPQAVLDDCPSPSPSPSYLKPGFKHTEVDTPRAKVRARAQTKLDRSLLDTKLDSENRVWRRTGWTRGLSARSKRH